MRDSTRGERSRPLWAIQLMDADLGAQRSVHPALAATRDRKFDRRQIGRKNFAPQCEAELEVFSLEVETGS
jgi:hypothetical protein